MAYQTVVYATDNNYRETMEASIKSLAYHNHNLKIYVINSDIPQEWFSNINRYLRLINSQIVDKKINEHVFDNLSAPRTYLSYMAYGRLFIPQMLNEEQVLYLDCDTIINGNLAELFQTNLRDHYVGAVRDSVIDGFNSGVMLINNKKLKQDDTIQKVFAAGKDASNDQTDQSALNAVFGSDYYSLDDKYNYMIGSESDLFYQPSIAGDYFKRLEKCSNPVIVHYTSANKPWLLTSSGRMRSLWWQYRDLPWSSVVTKKSLSPIRRPSQGTLFAFTHSENLQNLASLAQALPDYDFYIAAWTGMGEGLINLLQISNIHLYPTISGPLIDQLSNEQIAYLDIALDKEQQITEKAMKLNKPILTFESTSNETDYDNYHIFSDNDVAGMAAFIKQLSMNKEHPNG